MTTGVRWGSDPPLLTSTFDRALTCCGVLWHVCVRALAVREEGFGALFKGLWPNYLKVVPSIAIAFVTYEQVRGADSERDSQ